MNLRVKGGGGGGRTLKIKVMGCLLEKKKINSVGRTLTISLYH